MTILIVCVAVVLVVSATCSVTEASLYAVRMSYVRNLGDSHGLAGSVLNTLKANMERPIAAILIVNTAANTAGAAIAGAHAELQLGDEWVVWFSAGFTLAVLLFAEIIPKIVGVAYSERIAMLVALPLRFATQVLSPAIWFIERLSRLLKPQGPVFAAPEEEVHQMAVMSAEEGSILPMEADLVRNVLALNEVTAGEIMTPRSVVFKLRAEMTLQDVSRQVTDWPHSRIPLFSEQDPETWTGIVLRRDVLAAMANGEFDEQIQSFSRPIHFVSTKTPGHVLLQSFVKRRTHLFGVVDELGVIRGIVTLEDVLESLIGAEIVDETDVAVNMQEVARMRRCRHFDSTS